MKIPITQNTPEWHKFREGKIGASYAPIIMGDSEYMSRHALWMQLVGLKDAPTETAAMARGSNLEHEARLYFNMTHGKNMAPAVYVHDSIQWMMASLDGIDGMEILEIKCPGSRIHAIACEGKVPQQYYAQVQHQLAVTGALRAYYFSYDGNSGVTVEMLPDADYIQELIKQEEDFYNCVQSLRVPGDKAINQRIDELRSLRHEIKKLRAAEAAIEEELINATHGKFYEGNGARISLIDRLGAIDYNSIPELRGVDLELYRKPTTQHWRISI